MKTTLWLAANLLVASSVGAQVSGCTQPLPSGLVAWWRAESNAVDSVSQIAATYSGILPHSARYTNGLVDAAFRIGMRSYFIIPQQTALDVGGSNGFTIEGWINPDGLTRAQAIAEWNDGKNIGVGLMIRTNVLEGYLTGTATQTIRSVVIQSAAGLLRSGAWQHVAMTYDKGSGLAKIFLNGVSVAQTNLGQFRAATIAPLYLGFRRSGTFSGDYYHGGLDEFSVYGRALSAMEILSLHYAGNTGKCHESCQHPGLVSWWQGEKSAADGWDSNHGQTPLGLVTTTGKVGQTFSFFQRYVLVPDSASLAMSNALTIEAWVNPTTVTGAALRTILSKFDFDDPKIGDIANAGSSYFLGVTNGGRVIFKVSATGSPVTNATLISTVALPTNQWTHVTATFGQGSLRIYINGTQNLAAAGPATVYRGNANLGIGGLPILDYPGVSFAYPFAGLIDEVSIYNRELSAFEIQGLYADTNGKCPSAPIILSQPASQSVALGEDVKFQLGAVGTQPLRYQWFFRQLPLAWATNASLVLEKLKTNQAGPYQVRVTNTLASVWSTGVTLALLPAPVCTTTPAGLISWWPGDGNGADTMGSNNISFIPSAYATGKVDRAFSFLGIASYRATVLNSPSLNFSTNADFSVEMWIKAGASNSTYATVPLFEKRAGAFSFAPLPTSWVGYSLSLNQGRLAFALGSTTGRVAVASSYISPGPDLRDAMFHHVAVSVNRKATNGGSLYVDGQLVLTFDPTPRNGNLGNTSPLVIGAPTTPVSNSLFGGLIDEPAIYGRALSAAEVSAIWSAGAAGRCKVRPSIITQPLSQRVTIGSNATFSVVADGTPKLRYQWLRSGLTIFGATNQTYSFTVPQGSFSYSVRVTNLFGSVTSSNAVLTANSRPTIDGGNFSTLEDLPARVRFVANDPDKDPLTVVVVTPPKHGTVSGPVTNLIYTPARDFNGTDHFVLVVNDGLADSFPATVNVTVMPVNDAPVASSQAISLDEDSSVRVVLGAFDVEGEPLTYVSSAPAHGTLSGAPPNLVYQPATNYFGPDSFTFSASDGQTNSNIATVSLTVRPVNDAPFANIVVSPLVTNVAGFTNWLVLAAVCGNARAVLDGSGSSDVENDGLSYIWLDGTNQVSNAAVTTNFLAVGSHEITLRVNDGQAVGTSSATVEVVSPAQGVGIVIVLLHESDLGRKNAQPLIASLKLAAAAFDRCEAKPGVNQLEAFKNKVRAQIAPSNPELAARLIEAVEQVLRAVR